VSEEGSGVECLVTRHGASPGIRLGAGAALEPDRIAAVVDMFGAGTSVQAELDRQDVTRFGASRIVYQHAEERLRLRICCRRGDREGWVLAESLDLDALAGLRDRMTAALSVLPPSGPVEMADAGPDPGERSSYYPATAADSAADRVGWFESVRDRLGSGVDLGGSVSRSVSEHVVADAGGLLRHEGRTRCGLMVVAARDGVSSYGKALHRDSASIDPVALADRVLADLPTGTAQELPSAPRVLLAPQAVATLLATFAQLAVGARELSGGASPLSDRFGQQVLSPLVSLHDDGADPSGMPTGFDCQGATKMPVELLRAGVPLAGVHDRTTAARDGVAGTGHAVPPGWRFGAGPAASHLLLDAGASADADLLAVLGDGVWVQRVDYVRVLQPRQALVTGTTRDATRLVRGGRVLGPVPQFRFTVRLDDLLRDVIAVGERRERSETVFMESVVAPAMVVRSLGDLEPTGR